MGAALARNVASRGIPLAVHNRTEAKTEAFLSDHGDEGTFVAAGTVEDLVAALTPPRAILLMVVAGRPVDDVLASLCPLLEPGDVVLDGGNSDFEDTERRLAELEGRGLGYLGVGISGGEEGARRGPSIMPGGSRDAYARVEPVLTAVAARVDGAPCCAYMGDRGAGHYVKMVHNGIEYAVMQLVAEGYDLLRHHGLDNDEVADVLDGWGAGRLGSFLVEITSTVLRRHDDGGGGHLVDRVLDRAAQKGTGRKTVQSALELGVPVPTIAEAVSARSLSALKEERVAAATVLAGPPEPSNAGDRLVDDLEAALYAGLVVAYGQGFHLLAAAEAAYGWGLRPPEIASVWRGGCIIRARLLDHILVAARQEPPLAHLVLAPALAGALAQAQEAWRRTVAGAVAAGVPTPALSSALAYYDGYRQERSPAALIQAQRDLFGAHTYERRDRPGTFHSDWTQEHP
jgi:6-phosphogluconate dehydrogenase